jgi:hypothetical protein
MSVEFRRGVDERQSDIPGNNFYSGLTEFIAGVQAGYNFQAGHFCLASKVTLTGRLSIIRRCHFITPSLPPKTDGTTDMMGRKLSSLRFVKFHATL